jgi:hypothetical protein
MTDLAELERYVARLTGEQKAELDQILAQELKSKWLPEPANEPQVAAYYSKADLLLYGGSPGGGKTDLIVGLALTEHEASVIFRRQSTDLRGIEDRIIALAGRDGWNGADKIYRGDGRKIELGHLEKPGAEQTWQGRPHDFIGFDEGAQLSRGKVQFVMGWLRSVSKGQRRRVVIGSNPPMGGEGEWLVEWFAPWLDPGFANRASPGELRYAATAPDREGTTVWLPDGRKIVFTGERDYRYATDEELASADPVVTEKLIEPLTRTFIPSMLRNNPYLANTGYRAQLQSLPEPMRTILMSGDFISGRVDHQWQVIPTAWVKAAQARWTPTPPQNCPMTAIGADIAQGGIDELVLAPRHGPWFAPLLVKPGVEVPKPSDSAGFIVANRRNNAVIVVDMGGGYGGGVKERLEDNDISVRPYNGANESVDRTKDKQLKFVNKRAEIHWRFREALDPDQEGGSAIALPPDPMLAADLTAPRWRLTTRGIQVEDKDEIKKKERLGRSPDRGDAAMMSCSEGEKAIVARIKKAERTKLSGLPSIPVGSDHSNTGWMR